MEKFTQKHYIRNKYISRQIAHVSLVLLFMLMLGFISPIYIDKGEAATGTPNESVLTLSADNAMASVNLDAVSSTGSFAQSDVDATFSVATTNYTGYTLMVMSGSSSLSGTIGDSIYNLASIPNVLAKEEFDDPLYNNMWGYLPSRYNSVENTSFIPAPEGSDILDITSTPNEVANTYTIGMGIRADYNSPSGVYTNTFVVTAVANPVNYQVAFDDITADETVSDIPAAQSGNTSATSIILTNATPVRAGYTFASWCLGTVSEDGATCDGAEFAPGAVFGIDQTTLNYVTLYAVWTPNESAESEESQDLEGVTSEEAETESTETEAEPTTESETPEASEIPAEPATTPEATEPTTDAPAESTPDPESESADTPAVATPEE